jgi:hypothetical protein
MNCHVYPENHHGLATKNRNKDTRDGFKKVRRIKCKKGAKKR